VTELRDVRGGDAEPTIPWANTPDVTAIYDIDTGKELLRMPGLVMLPPGAIVQLGRADDRDNPPQDGIVRTIRLWSAYPGTTPLLRLDVDITLPN
jgi:hypothetical protein